MTRMRPCSLSPRRRLLRLAAGWLLCACAAAAATAAEDPPVAEHFPKSLGDLNLADARRFDHPAHGVSASYVAPDRKATVFIYTEGIAGIPDDIDDPIVRDAFGRACWELEEMGRLGYYLNVALVERGVATVELPWRDARLHHAVYSMELPADDGQPAARKLAHVYLASVQGTFLKARYTYPAGGDDAAPVPDLVPDLVPHLALAFMGGELVLSSDDAPESTEHETKLAGTEYTLRAYRNLVAGNGG